MRARLIVLGVMLAPLACIPGYGFVENDASVEAGADVTLDTGTFADAAADSRAALDGGAQDAPADGGGPFLVDNTDGGGCQIVTSAPADQGAAHIPVGTAFSYASDPATSGSHYDEWAAFTEFPAPVDPRYYVHSLEHGAIVYAYRCPTNTSCGGVLAALRSAVAAMPTDPLCSADAGTRVRAVMTPDPTLDVPIAVAAWGKLYKANCIDLTSMRQFAADNYGKGPESKCDQGRFTF